MTVNSVDFDFVVRMARDEAGIQLNPDQLYLVESRLSALIHREGLSTIEDLVSRVRIEPPTGELHRKVIEALVTSETYFFRDNSPFDALKNTLIPALMATRASTRTITIWCGASSTGQEPYSIAMLLKEGFPHLKEWMFRIIATDLSEENLEKARQGRYSSLQMSRGLPVELRDRYFKEVGSDWELCREIRAMVDYRQMNLIGPWCVNHADVVFLRNVMIYFDLPTKQDILKKIRGLLPTDGALFLGSCETTVAIDPDFDPIYTDNTVFFRKKAGG